MVTFAKVWALKSDVELQPGTVTQVSLKSGATKDVKVGALIGTGKDSWLYAPAE